MIRKIKYSLVILTLLRFNVNGQQYEGETCVLSSTNRNGVCKVLSQCPSVQADLRNRIYPTRCGFRGYELIVCCPDQVQISQKQKPGNRKPGEIANKMCNNYSQYVWTVEVSPLLLVGADDIKRRECPFDRLNLVVGGSPATRREFPHMVQIGFNDDSDNDGVIWGCGGSLISDQFVLTAAHCLDDRSLGEAQHARMGMVDLDDPSHTQQLRIIQRIPHPEFIESSHYHDIGLAKLNKKAEMNTWVRPACLYTSRNLPASNAIATGWGKVEFGGSESTILLRVILESYTQEFCNKVYKQNLNKLKDGIKDDLMVCMGHSTELKDTCQGDSGGPLMVYREGGQNKNSTCMYDIIGVTAFGKACGIGVNIPGVYTRVSNYMKWIEDNVWPQ